MSISLKMPPIDLKKLSELSSQYMKSNKAIKGIVLFGSAAKGKLYPGDLDVAILAELTDRAQLTGGLVRLLSENDIDAHVSTLFFDDIFSEPLWQSVIHEGISIINGEPLSKSLGFSSKTLFQFDPSKLDKSKRVRFQYALVGRDSKSGIIEDVCGQKISGNAIIVPVSSENKVIQFFDLWGISYTIKRLMAE
jgi:predicted nucleotidyltransferase